MRVTKRFQSLPKRGLGKATFRRMAARPTRDEVSQLLFCTHAFHAATAASCGATATTSSGDGFRYDRRSSRATGGGDVGYGNFDDGDNRAAAAFVPTCGVRLPTSGSPNASYGAKGPSRSTIGMRLSFPEKRPRCEESHAR